MTTSNVHYLENRSTLNHRRAERLRGTFRERERRQPEVFENLSRHVERLVDELKLKDGQKSGAIQKAFGHEFVRQKGRFTALRGQPPAILCRNPGNWLRVLEGLARELGRDTDKLVCDVLEDALTVNQKSSFGQDTWLSELDSLLSPMSEALASETDLPALADTIARSGLWLDDGKIVISEWPTDGGFSGGDLYNPDVIGLTPHLWGLNYTPVTAPSFDLTDSADLPLALAILKSNGVGDAEIAAAARLDALEATRTGLAFAIRQETGKPELALLEWQIAFLHLYRSDGSLLVRHLAHSDYPLPATMGGDVTAMYGATDGNYRTRPERWYPNTLRFHFRGTSGFDQMASSLIVEPWVYGDPDDLELLLKADLQDPETYPLACPAHTVGAAIESNLRYADDLGHPDLRLDRLLAKQIRRIQDLVSQFQQAGAARRQQTRDALMKEWRASAERRQTLSGEDSE